MAKLTKQEIRKAYAAAEEEVRKERVKELTTILRRVLEAIAVEQKTIREAQRRMVILRNDLEDLGTGRWEKIRDRQEKDTEVKRVSTVDVPRLEKLFLTTPTLGKGESQSFASTTANTASALFQNAYREVTAMTTATDGGLRNGE